MFEEIKNEILIVLERISMDCAIPAAFKVMENVFSLKGIILVYYERADAVTTGS